MKKLLLLIPVLMAVLGWLWYRQRTAPPEVPFAKVTRETLVSTLVTNGKVEPIEWVAVLAERTGLVEGFHSAPGARVNRGDPLVELGAEDAKAELAAAEARVSQARAELQLFERGGRAAALADLDAELSRAKMELEVAEKERASLEKLAAGQAATRQEVSEAVRRVERARLLVTEIAGKRATLVDPSERPVAQAKLREGEIAVEPARRRLEKAVIRAPLAGVVYDSAARLGTLLNTGDPVAKVGRIEKVRVRVYVDEPELGRVAKGMPVGITWDALQGRRWQGSVERMPTEITSLGTRQVGEVVCVIDNPGGALLPGTNVNAEIQSRVAEAALVMPREALRREGSDSGVYLLQGDKVAWRKVVIGISSITRTQVLEGLAEGDWVALPTDVPLASGLIVRPMFR